MLQKGYIILGLSVVLTMIISGCTDERPRCGIENCHGTDITCGPDVPDVCTEEYVLGDRCRQYVSCVQIEDECRMLTDDKFYSCISCVEKCKADFIDDISKAFECESKCPGIPSTQETYCEVDEDCACGIHKTTKDCFYGNKDYVDTQTQCPDFCTGIAGNLKIECIDNKCQQAMTTR